jgi:hypothetical protein
MTRFTPYNSMIETTPKMRQFLTQREKERNKVNEQLSSPKTVYQMFARQRTIIHRMTPDNDHCFYSRELGGLPTDLSPRKLVQGRRGFFTSHGYIGIGPKHARAGDIIVVLYGAKVPFILRRDGDYHRLVGECVATHLMSGNPSRLRSPTQHFHII